MHWKHVLACVSLSVLLATAVYAKRSAPKAVAPLTQDGIVYSAPPTQMGFVVATSEQTGRVIWLRQIYVVKYDVQLEKDVQDCFITSLSLKDGKLLVANEAGGEYGLDLDSLDVKVIKGKSVIDRTRSGRK